MTQPRTYALMGAQVLLRHQPVCLAHHSPPSFECFPIISPILLLFFQVCCSQPFPPADSFFFRAGLPPRTFIFTTPLVSYFPTPAWGFLSFASTLIFWPWKDLLLSAKVPATNSQQSDQIFVAAERNQEAHLSESSVSFRIIYCRKQLFYPHSWVSGKWAIAKYKL